MCVVFFKTDQGLKICSRLAYSGNRVHLKPSLDVSYYMQ